LKVISCFWMNGLLDNQRKERMTPLRFSILKIIGAALPRMQRARRVASAAVVLIVEDQVAVGADFPTRTRLHLQRTRIKRIESKATTETPSK